MLNREQENNFSVWKLVGFIVLSARFVQGWIFWGGGSRRFIYDPSKLDPYSSEWMANKLQSAMPGALLGTGDAVNFLLQHFVWLYTAIIAFSLAELCCGLGLILGFFTRLAGFGTVLISIALMLLFGWQGATCMDEWTMAVANLALGLTLTVSGGAAYSIDSLLLQRYPKLSNKTWFRTITSGSLPDRKVKMISLIFLLFAIVFTLTTYNYYRGSILTPYHSGPVSTGEHHITLSSGRVNVAGTVSFTAYIDAGTPAVPSHITRIELVDEAGKVIEVWQGKDLAKLPRENIKNIYDYNRITTGPYGLVAPLSAKAEIKLSAVPPTHLKPGNYQLQVYAISGQRFTLAINQSV